MKKSKTLSALVGVAALGLLFCCEGRAAAGFLNFNFNVGHQQPVVLLNQNHNFNFNNQDFQVVQDEFGFTHFVPTNHLFVNGGNHFFNGSRNHFFFVTPNQNGFQLNPNQCP